MDKFLTKYYWIFNIVIVAAMAYFLASGVGQVAASKIEEMLPKTDVEKKVSKIVRPVRQKSFSTIPPVGDAVLSRNVFDSATGPISRLPETEETDPSATQQPLNASELPIVPCTMGGIKLISTIASKEDPYWSFATVDSGGGAISMYRMGDSLSGRTVSGVTWRYLFLRGTTDECYMDMFPDPNAPAPPPPPRAVADASTEPQASGPADSRIQKLSDTEAVVERSLINELLANPTNFVKSVRVRPEREGGKVVGYKLRRFQANSPLAALGAQKGDVIKAVNGQDINSMDKALGAFQSLRSANDLTFSITRNGKPMDLKVSIR